MHEMHAVKSIIAIIKDKCKENNISRASKINVVLGKLSGITKEDFIYWYNELSKDTPAGGAQIEFKETLEPTVYLESIEV